MDIDINNTSTTPGYISADVTCHQSRQDDDAPSGSVTLEEAQDGLRKTILFLQQKPVMSLQCIKSLLVVLHHLYQLSGRESSEVNPLNREEETKHWPQLISEDATYRSKGSSSASDDCDGSLLDETRLLDNGIFSNEPPLIEEEEVVHSSKYDDLEGDKKDDVGSKSSVKLLCGQNHVNEGNPWQIEANIQRVHRCGICGKVYNHRGHMLQHMKRYHDDETPYRCGCSVTFNSINNLVNHMKQHGCGGLCECTMCEDSFTSVDDLGEHIDRAAIHTNSQPHQCDICAKLFGSIRNLKNHMLSHAIVKPHTCSFCGKGFSHKESLRAHIRTHTGEKPYICDTCGKAFCEAGSIKRHMRSHTGERPYVCETCGKSFIRDQALKLHERKHTGERPFVCSICGKTFADRRTLLLHDQIHSGVKPYKCHICNKHFRRTYTLHVHMKTHAIE